MPTVYVNDKPVDIGNEKLNLHPGGRTAGVFIPRYCWHPALTVVASCRMCLVEVGDMKPTASRADAAAGRPRLPDAGQGRHRHRHRRYDKRDTRSGLLRPGYKGGAGSGQEVQADTLEGLLLNHPLDCPVCDKAGECMLQDFSYEYGRSESRMIDAKNTPPNKPRHRRARSRCSPTAASCARAASASPARSAARPNCRSSTAATTRRSTSSPASRSTTSWPATSSICARSAPCAARTSSTSSASGI